MHYLMKYISYIYIYIILFIIYRKYIPSENLFKDGKQIYGLLIFLQFLTNHFTVLLNNVKVIISRSLSVMYFLM